MIKYFVFLSFFVVLYAKPIWIDDPSMGGKYVGAVGYAQKKVNFKIQERKAFMQAQASLSHMQNLTITDTSVITIDEFGDENADFSAEISSDTIILSKEKDRYIDEDGSLYIWLIQIKGK